MKTTWLILIVQAFLLIACGPVYKKSYDYIPPKRSLDRICASQCSQNKSNCMQMCRMETENCQLRDREDALRRYEEYRYHRERHGKSIDHDVSWFANPMGCEHKCGCVAAYNSCFTNCGGQVIEKKECVAFCDRDPQI